MLTIAISKTLYVYIFFHWIKLWNNFGYKKGRNNSLFRWYQNKELEINKKLCKILVTFYEPDWCKMRDFDKIKKQKLKICNNFGRFIWAMENWDFVIGSRKLTLSKIQRQNKKILILATTAISKILTANFVLLNKIIQ